MRGHWLTAMVMALGGCAVDGEPVAALGDVTLAGSYQLEDARALAGADSIWQRVDSGDFVAVDRAELEIAAFVLVPSSRTKNGKHHDDDDDDAHEGDHDDDHESEHDDDDDGGELDDDEREIVTTAGQIDWLDGSTVHLSCEPRCIVREGRVESTRILLQQLRVTGEVALAAGDGETLPFVADLDLQGIAFEVPVELPIDGKHAPLLEFAATIDTGAGMFDEVDFGRLAAGGEIDLGADDATRSALLARVRTLPLTLLVTRDFL